MKLRLTVLLALVAAVVTTLTIAPTAPAAPPPMATAPSTLPITGNVVGGGTFTGTLSNLHFVDQNGVLAVAGNLTGTLTNAAGQVIGTIAAPGIPITLPIGGAQASGSCKILHMTLGPLN